MPLPKLPGHTTSRYKLRYVANGVSHSITCHVNTGTTSGQAVQLGTDLANLLKNLVNHQTVFQSIEWANLGQDIFNPIASLNIAGVGLADLSQQDGAKTLSLTGRSPSGRKTRMIVFGTHFPLEANWRYERAENTNVATVVDALNAGTGGVACVDASMPVWHQYFNVGYHDHYIRKLRQGAG